MRKALYILLIVCLLFTLCSCGKKNVESTTETTVPVKEEEKPVDQNSTPKNTWEYTYTELDVPYEVSFAEDCVIIYQNATQIVFSLGEINSSIDGPSVKTNQLALMEIGGETTYYSVDTQAYILSAVPFQDGLLYVDYKVTSEQCNWRLVLTDGTKTTVLDEGTANYYGNAPSVFLLEDVPYYVWKEDDHYTTKRVVDLAAEVVNTEIKCKLYSGSVISNGKVLCYMTDTLYGEYANYVVANDQGILQSFEVEGLVASWGITEDYVTVVVGEDPQRAHNVQLLNIETGEITQFAKPIRQIYQIRGVGNTAICVDSQWKPVMLDMENQATVEMELSVPSDVLPRRYYPMDDMQYLVVSGTEGLAFYVLTITK